MDREQYVHKRKGRYMAQTLESFEDEIEPLLSASVSSKFKALVRRKMNALAVDCCELMKLEENGQLNNGAAQAVKDSIFPDGRPGSQVQSAQQTRR